MDYMKEIRLQSDIARLHGFDSVADNFTKLHDYIHDQKPKKNTVKDKMRRLLDHFKPIKTTNLSELFNLFEPVDDDR